MKRFFNFALFAVFLFGCFMLSDTFASRMDTMGKSIDSLTQRN
ncbi:MAG: hypothetical protein ACRER5_09300 [Pseudomonas sp.]